MECDVTTCEAYNTDYVGSCGDDLIYDVGQCAIYVNRQRDGNIGELNGFRIGHLVRFHPIIGLKHDGGVYRIWRLCYLYGKPVAFLEYLNGMKKPGCVSIEALSRYENLQGCGEKH